MKRFASVILILLAAICWGLTGFFNRTLGEYGLSSEQVLFVRCFVTLVAVGIYCLILDRKSFRVRPKDLWVFVGSGLLSMTMFGLAYMSAMREMDLSIAVVLLYTSPIWVVILSAILFKERITKAKVLALVLVAAGAVLATGVLSGNARITPLGLGLGLVSGLGYALYSIFTRIAYNKGYGSNTVTFYTFLFASVVVGFVANLPGLAANTAAHFAAGQGPQAVFWMIAMGAVTCLFPYCFYTKGLEGVETGRASVIATVEIVVSTLVSVLVYGEPFTLGNVGGILLVIAGVAVINLGAKAAKPGEDEG